MFKIIRQVFGPYITGYADMKKHPLKCYILVPKDDNWSNISVQNLKFVSQKEYREIDSKKKQIKNVLSFCPDISDKTIQEKTGVSRPHISRIKRELAQNGQLPNQKALLDYRETYGIQITQENFPIYQALLASDGNISNMDLAKKLRPEALQAAQTPDEKRVFTDKIVRVRRLLADNGLIPPPDSFKGKREDALRMIKDKPNS